MLCPLDGANERSVCLGVSIGVMAEGVRLCIPVERGKGLRLGPWQWSDFVQAEALQQHQHTANMKQQRLPGR